MPQHILDPALARALSEVIIQEVSAVRSTFDTERAALLERIDVLQGRIGALEVRDEDRAADVKRDHLNLENLHDRVMAMEAKPPPDLDALEQKLTVRFEALTEATRLQIEAIPPPVDLAPLETKFGILQQMVVDHHDELVGAVTHVEQRFAADVAALPAPTDLGPLETRIADVDLQLKTLPIPDLTPLAERIAALEARPCFDDVARTEIHADLSLALTQSLERKVAALPPPAKGDKGDKGDKGEDGKNGTSVSLEEVRIMLDGVAASWQLDFERRAWEEVRRVLDSIPLPKDGVDGKDGFSLKDFSLTYDGERTIEFKFAGEDVERVWQIEVPWPLDRKQYKRGTAYKKGDGVSYGGSWFIAQRDTTPEEVPETSDAWRLAVKHGRDGKNGKNGDRGEKGEKGDRGRDLTQLDYTTGRRF